jgi:hypothetical protein
VSGDAIVVDMLDPAVNTLFRKMREIVNAKPPREMKAGRAEQRRCIHLLRAIGAFIEETWRDFAPILASGISAGQYERDRATPMAIVPGFSGNARHTGSVDGQGQFLPESRGPGR